MYVCAFLVWCGGGGGGGGWRVCVDDSSSTAIQIPKLSNQRHVNTLKAGDAYIRPGALIIRSDNSFPQITYEYKPILTSIRPVGTIFNEI